MKYNEEFSNSVYDIHFTSSEKMKRSHCTSLGYHVGETQELVILKGHRQDQIDVSWTKTLTHVNNK